MRTLLRFFNRLRISLRRESFHSELNEEMRVHREMAEQELLANGATAEQARRQAAQQFGNSTRLAEQSYEAIRFSLETVLQDVRFAARQLRRNPGFALTATLTLALGVGAVTAIFSVAYGVLIDPFPYKDVKTLVTPKICSPDLPRCYWNNYTPGQFLEIQSKTDVFSGVTASTISDITLTGAGEPQHLRGNYITPNTFDVLGVSPILGRASQATDVLPGHAEVALISYRYWQAHYGGSPSILGRVLTLNSHPRTIIGVMPPRFLWRGGDVYLPIEVTNSESIQDQNRFTLLGRLKPGVSEPKASAELQAIFKDFAHADPRAFPKNFRVGVMPFDEMFQSGLASTLYLLLGAVFVLLLIACVNVSSLLLARAVNREHEFAVRAAIGATRGRLLRFALTESLLLAVLAVPFALLFAWLGLQGTLRLVPTGTIPDEALVSMNIPVLLASIGLALLTVLFFGLLPAWQSARPRPAAAMTNIRSSKSGSQRRLLSSFVVAEISLCLALLMLAGLMVRSLVAVEQAPLPFSPDHTAMMRVVLDKTRYPKPEDRIAFFQQLLERISHQPGVKAASVDSQFPYYEQFTAHVQIGNGPVNQSSDFAFVHLVSPQFLLAASQPMLEGHFIDDREISEHAQDIVVTELFAQHFFPGQNALGHSVHLPDFASDPSIHLSSDVFTIVGIMHGMPMYPGFDREYPQLFLPFTVAPVTDALVVTTSLPAKQLLDPLRKMVYSIDSQQPVFDTETLEHLLDMYGYASPRFALVLFGTFAGAALLLALVGIYGVFSFVTSQRTQEIGIRMALGANRSQVVWMILRHACMLALYGIGLGLPLAFLAGYLAKDQLVLTSQHDPLTLFAVICIVPVLAVAGTCLPAYRASVINPTQALRSE